MKVSQGNMGKVRRSGLLFSHKMTAYMRPVPRVID